MSKKPLVSVITVTYNAKSYLEQTIQSVFAQTYPHIEYIIIDGASTDGTLDIIKRHEKKIAFWVSEKDNGIYDAMNKGIRAANGELIGIINASDYYEPDTISEVVKHIYNIRTLAFLMVTSICSIWMIRFSNKKRQRKMLTICAMDFHCFIPLFLLQKPLTIKWAHTIQILKSLPITILHYDVPMPM